MVPPWVSIGVKSSPKEVSNEAAGGAVVFNTGSGARGGAVPLNYSNHGVQHGSSLLFVSSRAV